MPYILGASFSNLQHSFNSPTYFVAVAVESAGKPELENITTKDEFVEDSEYKMNPFDLSRVENEISRFEGLVIKGKIIKLTRRYREKGSDDLSFIFDGYLRAIESTKSSNLYLASEGFEKCYLHVPLDRKGNELAIEDLDYFRHPLSKYKIEFQRKGDFDKILELARLHVWFENSNNVRRQKPFINKQITTNRNYRFFQINKILWNNPPIEFYPNNFVGYPRMVVKTRYSMKDMLIFPGKTLDIFPISLACSGRARSLDVPMCVQASPKKPFGAILSDGRFEKCRLCAENMKGSRCLFQKPKCDGKQMLCDDRVFISQVCHADFSIYITLYDGKIKVGRSLKSRTVARLIEQCAFDGLVFYPVPWLPFADYLEEKLANLLKNNITGLKEFDVSGITEKITSKERYEHAMSLCENVDVELRDAIYSKLVELLNSLDCPEAIYLSSLEQRKINLQKNWIVPKRINLGPNDLVEELRFKRIRGSVAGIIGSFIIFNNKVCNTTELEGYIVGVPS